MKEKNAAMSCGEVRSLLSAFLADELSPAESRRVQEHLEGCAACAGFRRFEDAFDIAMKRSLRTGAAPASLVVKIHRALDEEDTGQAAPARRVMARPWAPWALAASLLVAILGPGILGVRTGVITLPVSAAGVILSTEGTLVCAECTRQGRPVSEQRGCRAHGHHAALRADNGALWEFVENDLSRPLILDADRLGDRIEVQGLFLDDIRYVRVNAYRYMDGQGASQGL